MDKKQLYALVDNIVEQIAQIHGLEEAEARVFVGVALRKNREAFLSTVVVPTLVVSQPAAPPAAPLLPEDPTLAMTNMELAA